MAAPAACSARGSSESSALPSRRAPRPGRAGCGAARAAPPAPRQPPCRGCQLGRPRRGPQPGPRPARRPGRPRRSGARPRRPRERRPCRPSAAGTRSSWSAASSRRSRRARPPRHLPAWRRRTRRAGSLCGALPWRGQGPRPRPRPPELPGVVFWPAPPPRGERGAVRPRGRPPPEAEPRPARRKWLSFALAAERGKTRGPRPARPRARPPPRRPAAHAS